MDKPKGPLTEPYRPTTIKKASGSIVKPGSTKAPDDKKTKSGDQK